MNNSRMPSAFRNVRGKIRWLRRQKDQLFRHFTARCASLDFDSIETREWFVEALANLLNVETSALLFVQEDGNELVVYRASLQTPEWYYPIPYRWDQSLVENCRSRKNAPPSERSPLTSPAIFDEILSLDSANIQYVPVVYQNQALGGVILLNKQHGPFNTTDRDMIAEISTIIARSIYNSRLVKQLNVANAELEVSRSQLLHSRNTLRALFDSVPISIYIIDAEYNLSAVNMERARRTDCQPSQLVSEPCYKALFGREDVCPDCLVHLTFIKGQSINRVKRQWENDNEPLEWEIDTYPIFDGANRVIQAIVFEQDVTEKRRLEANLIRSEKLAAVGQLAAGIAHEINNPLTAILANAQMLQREIPEDDDRQELVDLISRAGSRASQVVRNLLDLARKEKFEFQPTDVNDTIRKSIELLQFEIAKRSVDLVFEPAEDLPMIRASQDHLEGVWINLLTNAMDALRNGQSSIQVSTRQVGSEVHVIVSDSGEGISPEALSRIFEPFFTTKSPGEGTGLGLSVVHRIIKQHGGMIHVDSEVNRGTQFTVALPIK